MHVLGGVVLLVVRDVELKMVERQEKLGNGIESTICLYTSARPIFNPILINGRHQYKLK